MIYPTNKKHFIKLIDFSKELLKICDKIKVKPIIYGSYMLLDYTKNKKLKINDIDFYIREKDLSKVIKVLKEKGINHDYSGKWHTLQVKKGNLKIEFDSLDFWYNGPKKLAKVNLNGKIVRALSLEGLKHIYKKASETSKDNPEGNLRKYNSLLKVH